MNLTEYDEFHEEENETESVSVFDGTYVLFILPPVFIVLSVLIVFAIKLIKQKQAMVNRGTVTPGTATSNPQRNMLSTLIASNPYSNPQATSNPQSNMQSTFASNPYSNPQATSNPQNNMQSTFASNPYSNPQATSSHNPYINRHATGNNYDSPYNSSERGAPCTIL